MPLPVFLGCGLCINIYYVRETLGDNRLVKGIYRYFTALAQLVGLAVCMPGVLQAADVKSLSGYKAYSTLSSFKAFLEDNPDVYEKLKNDPALSEEVLGNTARQREMMRAQNVQESPQDNSTVSTTIPADTLTRDEQATQAANEAIIRALAEKEAANKRAQETLRLITQQEALINQARAEAELAANEAKMENIKAAFDGHPEKQAQFFANTALLQKVMDNRLSLQEALAEAGITLEQTTEPELTETPGPETIETPEDQLVHVYGNKYRLGDKELYDLNHVPSEEEMALDDNGWPKFLNVPAECGPADPDVTYFFENRYGFGFQTKGGYSSLVEGAAMNRISNMGLLLKGYTKDVGLTDDEVFAAPFYVPNVAHPTVRRMRVPLFVPDSHTGVRNGFFSFSISHCPGSWDNTTPSGKTPMLEGCVARYGDNFFPYGGNISINVREADAPNIINKHHKRRSCIIEPGKRYFFNFASRHHADPDAPSITEHMIERMKKLARWHPERYPLSPEENLQNYIDGSGKARGGKYVGSASWFDAAVLFASRMPRSPKQRPEGAEKAGKRYPLKLSKHGNYYSLIERDGRRIRETFRACNHGISTTTCYDPHGKLPPLRQTTKCTGPKQITWVEGFNDKAFNHYICFNNNHENLSWLQNRYCLARNEGDFRQIEYKNPKPAHRSRIRSTRTIEQCQYDKNRKRFDWITVEAETSKKDLGGHPNHNRKVGSDAADIAPRDTCSLADKDVQLGDSVRITCPNTLNSDNSNRSDSTFSLNLTCRRVADAPALPVLVNENGFGLNRIPTDPESSSRVHPLLNWLPNCTVE